MTPAMRYNRWLLTLALLAPMASAHGQSSKPVFIAINDDLRYFVELAHRRHSPPLASFEINETILTAALLFDALGAYGIRCKAGGVPSKLFVNSELPEPDSLYANPPLRVFTSRLGSCEELAVLYAGILEAAGVSSAIATAGGRVLVLVNSGINKKYAGAVSRDVTSYIVKNQLVWLPVDVARVGSPFQQAWRRIDGRAPMTIFEVIPVRVLIKAKEIGTGRVFSSNLSRSTLDRLFVGDRAFWESAESKRKWQKVQALIAEDRKLAMIHFNRGAQHLSSNQPDLAIAEFYRAAEFGGDLSQLLFFIAKAYGEKQDYQMMKKIGQQLIEAQKRDPRGYQILGLAFYNSGDKETSKQLLARAKFLERNSHDLANKN